MYRQRPSFYLFSVSLSLSFEFSHYAFCNEYPHVWWSRFSNNIKMYSMIPFQSRFVNQADG